jgi:hypothetical protein
MGVIGKGRSRSEGGNGGESEGDFRDFHRGVDDRFVCLLVGFAIRRGPVAEGKTTPPVQTLRIFSGYLLRVPEGGRRMGGMRMMGCAHLAAADSSISMPVGNCKMIRGFRTGVVFD